MSLPEMFEAQVARTPDAVAVIGSRTRLTYDEVNRRANRLARHLVSLGAGPETVVAVVLPRRPDVLVALLAVLKSGAAYLPVDPANPGRGSTHWSPTRAPGSCSTRGRSRPARIVFRTTRMPSRSARIVSPTARGPSRSRIGCPTATWGCPSTPTRPPT
ncbi:AMP-binding protein [Streptomyces sp. LBUM 1478]|nr:AMP-binding protein [Streptomyces sp. LBUM 1478]